MTATLERQLMTFLAIAAQVGPQEGGGFFISGEDPERSQMMISVTALARIMAAHPEFVDALLEESWQNGRRDP